MCWWMLLLKSSSSSFASVGVLFRDVSSKQLLHEFGVFARGTANQMLAGKDLNSLCKAFIAWFAGKGRHYPEIEPFSWRANIRHT